MIMSKDKCPLCYHNVSNSHLNGTLVDKVMMDTLCLITAMIAVGFIKGAGR